MTDFQKLDRPYAQQPETRAAAVRVLERMGAGDLVDVLGLDQVEPERPRVIKMGGRLKCAVCWCPVRGDGICRQRKCGGGR